MAKTAAPARDDLYASYEEALAGLLQVPTLLRADLSSAQKAHEAAMSAAAANMRSEEDRLARLRRTLTTRYSESAKNLQAANVLIPSQVRAAPAQAGDEQALARAVNAQQEAERAVRRALRAAIDAGAQRATEEKARAAAGREAAEALRRRQEQVRKARQETEAEAERQRLLEAARAKRSRQLLFGGGAALLLLLVVVSALLVL